MEYAIDLQRETIFIRYIQIVYKGHDRSETQKQNF